MSGFDLPPIQGLDRSFRPIAPQGPQGPQGGFVSPEVANDLIDVGRAPSRTASPFDGVLADSLNHVRGLQLDAKQKVEGLVMGEDVALHDVMIAGKKSQAAFNLVLEVRNKLIDAWEKLSRSAV